MTTKPPDYAASFAPVMGGRLVMICADEANARPWVRLLTGAGLTLEKHPPAGRYSFTFDGRPELTGEDPAPAAADLAELAPAMLALLRRMLELYDAQNLLPMDRFPAFWQDVRAVIGQAEGA